MIKTSYNIINNLIKQNHRNILTLADLVSPTFCCVVVSTSIVVGTSKDNCMRLTRMGDKQQ